MNNIINCDISGGYLYFTNSDDSNFTWLIEYLRETPFNILHLVDPSKSTNEYAQGNYYYHKQDGLYYYIADDPYQFESDEVYEPLIILLNTLEGILNAFNYMYDNKINYFSIIKEYKRYVFQADGIEPIIIDPDQGKLYNNGIPLIIMRRINNQWVPELCNNNYTDLRTYMLDEELLLFYDFFLKNYNPETLYTLYTWGICTVNVYEKQQMVLNSVRIKNERDTIDIRPAKKKDEMLHLPRVIKRLQVLITKESLIKFLQAWESKLQHSDAFTLVFLGQTLRFFEGEPL